MRHSVSSLAALALASRIAFAQPMAPSRVEAYIRMRQGEAALQRGDTDEALRLYREAANQGAPPLVYRSLALTLEQRSRWREAAEAWTRYATLADRATERTQAVARREALRRMLTTVRVRVVPATGARLARVWFDRDPPRWYQAGGVQSVGDGGEHRVRVEAAGFMAWEQRVITGYGETLDLVVTLTLAIPPVPR